MNNQAKENEKSDWAQERLPAHLSVQETRGIEFTIPTPSRSSVSSTSPILDALTRRDVPSHN
jgi:hypothetical protein